MFLINQVFASAAASAVVHISIPVYVYYVRSLQITICTPFTNLGHRSAPLPLSWPQIRDSVALKTKRRNDRKGKTPPFSLSPLEPVQKDKDFLYWF